MEQQVIQLNNLLVMFKCNAALCNISTIGGGSNVGKIKFSKNISKNCNSVKIINHSITGFYSEEIDLLK